MNIATKPEISKGAAIAWAGSSAELARRLGVTPSAVSQWDDALPDGRVWQLLALGCPVPQSAEKAGLQG